MARDYTKYNVEDLGENLNKRQLVFTIVKDWVEKNNPSFEELQQAFPDEVQGSKGFIRKESEVKDPKRFNMREPISIKNGMHIVVSNQWGNNIDNFIECAANLSYKINLIKQEAQEQSSQDDLIKLYNFELETPFPKGIEVVKISVANCPEKMYQDLGQRIVVHYSTSKNAILKHNSDDEEAVFEYLDVLEADIPESYVQFQEWNGDIYLSGQLNGQDWDLTCHGGDVEDKSNVNEELENALLKNFNGKNIYKFIDEVLNKF